MLNWNEPHFDNSRENKEEAMYNWAKGKADEFEAYVGTFLKHPIQAKSFAFCIATAIQDSASWPSCMGEVDDIDADCFMYVNRVATKANARWVELDEKVIEKYFDRMNDDC